MSIPRLKSVKSAAKAFLEERNKPKNPLDSLVEYTGDQEVDSINELAQVAKGKSALGKAIDQQREAIALNNDTEFWFCVPFNSRAQKEAVLEALGLLEAGDKYIDPLDFCRSVGVQLPPSDFVPKKPKYDKRLEEFL